MPRRPAALAFLALSFIGCGALTSHSDVAARAGSQELSSAKLAEMMAAAQMPPRKDLGLAVANLWVNYQLLAQAGAKSDTMATDQVADEAMWAQIAQTRLRKFQIEMQKGFVDPDPASFEKAYENGEGFLVAQHILIAADSSPAKVAAAKLSADNIRKQLTSANFGAMAKRHSADPGSKDNGGEYVFPAGQMVAEFEQGTRALKPGDISQPIKTQFGFHIIRRETYAEAKSKWDSTFVSSSKQRAESIYIAGMDKASKITVKDGAAKTVKAIAEDVDSYRDDKTVLATSKSFDLRASRVALWMAAFPAQMQIRRQLQQAPDSAMPDFLKNLMRNELMLKAADSAKVVVDSAELTQIRMAFRQSVQNAMGSLGLLPSQLADSAKSNAEKATLGAARVDAYMAKLLKNEAQFVDVSEPLSLALRRKYTAKVTVAGIDKAVTQVTEAKAKADSLANVDMPTSDVPMPGGGTPPASISKEQMDAMIKQAEEEAKKGAAAGSKKP